MLPSKIIDLIKSHIEKFSKEDYASILTIVNAYNDPNNIIIPIKDNGIRVFNTDDIFHIYCPKKGIILINTYKETIEYCCQATNLLEYVANHDDNFKYVNNGRVVNLTKINEYHSYNRVIYFTNGEKVDITGVAMDRIIKKSIGIEKDLYTPKESNREYILALK